MSVHIAERGVRRSLALLRRGRRPLDAPGLRYSEAAGLTPLAAPVPTLPPRATILISSWDDDDALDRFLTAHPIEGYHVRMRPTRIVGAWPDMPGLPTEDEPMEPDEPATVLTLGRPRGRTFLRFVRTSRPAEKLAIDHPGLVAGTAAARLPRFVATFSIWRTVAEMRDYALGRPDPRHLNAIKANRATPFHHQDAFVRFRPYASSGSWRGRDPLAAIR
ncbi:MAG: spheroidene monooxygenase [Thermoleophilaceae bacterium]